MEDKIRLLFKLREEGFGSKIISKQTELAPATCQKWIKAYDLCTGRRSIDGIGIKVIELRQKGLGIKDISRNLNTPLNAILPYVVYCDGLEESLVNSIRDNNNKSKPSDKPVKPRKEKVAIPKIVKENRKRHFAGFINPYINEGIIAEKEIILKLSKMGYRIFEPFNSSDSIDFILVSETGKVTKCQVKSANNKIGTGRYNFRLVQSRKGKYKIYKESDIDVFLLFCLDSGNVMVLPFNEYKNKTTASISDINRDKLMLENSLHLFD